MEIRTEAHDTAKLDYTKGKHLAGQIFLDAMAAIDVRRAMLAKLKREGGALVAGGVSIPLLRPPCVVAFGKAAHRMVAVLDEILSGGIEAGVSVGISEPAQKLARVRYFAGGHPYPNEGSLAGARAALELVDGMTQNDFVVFLVSGGGSAILELPANPAIRLADLLEFNRLLVTGGLPIEHMNVLRKHLSAVKGGRLGLRAHPARQLTVFISDVPEHLPSIVASGPTMPDESKVEDCYALAERYGLTKKWPASIRVHFEKKTLEETPKPGDERFANSRYFCLLSNRDALEAARAAAEKLGFVTAIDSAHSDGDFKPIADASLAALEALARAHPEHPVCVVSGGEVTCPVTGPGTGGRNQATVLYAAQKIAGQKRVVLSAGTDGRDGNSTAAGAVADGETSARARLHRSDPERFLAESDSYHFFRTLGDTIETGFTDNNVRDLRLWLAFP